MTQSHPLLTALSLAIIVNFVIVHFALLMMSLQKPQKIAFLKFMVPQPSAGQGLLIHEVFDEGWNFNSGNYLFTTDTK